MSSIVLLLTQFIIVDDDWHETGCTMERHMCAMPSTLPLFPIFE
jgi:hypothetical protein